MSELTWKGVAIGWDTAEQIPTNRTPINSFKPFEQQFLYIK